MVLGVLYLQQNANPSNSIVGAGIGGLASAVAFRRNGHNVQIFEAAEIKTEIGDALRVLAFYNSRRKSSVTSSNTTQ
ncbi:hypothetical protein K438DRAFT_1884958 [Mycena galopus ATCC 62051]|nr:hypothetical protein K438DRAFT_1884958 [Mycena galopus ATCC 62051]